MRRHGTAKAKVEHGNSMLQQKAQELLFQKGLYFWQDAE